MPGDGRCQGTDRRGRAPAASFPNSWHETYATADIVEYDGVPMVKIGREFLLRKNGARKRHGH